MKKTVVVLRVLCTLLDAILIMIPLQFLMIGVFQVPAAQADLLYKFLRYESSDSVHRASGTGKGDVFYPGDRLAGGSSQYRYDDRAQGRQDVT